MTTQQKFKKILQQDHTLPPTKRAIVNLIKIWYTIHKSYDKYEDYIEGVYESITTKKST